VSDQIKGRSELALMAEHLPVRGRIGLAVMAADLALHHLEPLRSFPLAQKAFELARCSFDGGPVDPDRFEEAIHNERDEGIAICAQHAKSEPEISAWLALGSALLYVAFHAYRALGQFPTPLVYDVEEDELDALDGYLKAISPGSFGTLGKAVRILERNEGLSFAQLKAAISKA
jgi:hypothetical protein